MNNENDIVPSAMHKDFEGIKKIGENGYEFWDARELMLLLRYKRWEDFHIAIKRAQVTCLSAKQSLDDHFRDVPKMVEIGSGAIRKQANYQLSRFACYLIAENGDPRKPEIAFAQTYFAVQTRKQELFESLDDDGKRLFVRRQVSIHYSALHETAQHAGVQNFGKFNNYGYIGLYGIDLKQIKQKKGIGDDELLDRAGSTELAANLFRITQTDAKLKKESIRGEDAASKTHFYVGRSVRETIEKIGGTMPEDLPAEENIKLLAKKKLVALPKNEGKGLR